jgi:dCMP deaminase
MKTEQSVWDDRWLRIAKEVSTWSKDPSTGVGAVAVRNNFELAKGYNGFPAVIPDRAQWLEDRQTKYSLIIHAEMNVINNAARTGTPLDGSTIYVYGLPICDRCLPAVLNAGITRFVIEVPKWREDWEESWSKSKQILSWAAMSQNWALKKEGVWEHGSLRLGSV